MNPATPVPVAGVLLLTLRFTPVREDSRAGVFFWRKEMTIDSTLMATVVFLLSSGMVAIAQQTPEKFAAATVTRTGHLTFDAPVEKVFPLFTPLGERNWAPGWNPEILYPADGTP